MKKEFNQYFPYFPLPFPEMSDEMVKKMSSIIEDKIISTLINNLIINSSNKELTRNEIYPIIYYCIMTCVEEGQIFDEAVQKEFHRRFPNIDNPSPYIIMEKINE